MAQQIINNGETGLVVRNKINANFTEVYDKQDKPSEGAFVNGDKTKLDSIETGATANSSNAFLLNRTNHTGTQTASTISNFDTAVSNNSSVTANSAKVSASGSVTSHSDVTNAGSGAIITTPERNQISTNTSNISNKQNILSEGAFVNGDKTKLDGIEAEATADQTPLQIKTAYEANANTNAFTDAEQSKLSGIATGATSNPNAIESDQAGEINAITTKPTPVSGDVLLIEDSADTFNKKKITVGSLPTGGGGEANTASNIGVGGVGVFDQKSGVDLQFKNINTGSNKVTVTDDLANNEIDIDVDEANLSLGNISGNSDNITEGSINLFLTGAERVKIINTETSLQLDARDTANRNRANHTGTQLLSTISDSGALASLNTVNTAQIDNDAVTIGKIADANLSGVDTTLITGTISTTNAITKVDSNNDLVETGILVDTDNAISGYDASVNALTGTLYTLVATDTGKVITLNNASAITVTVPAGLGAGFNCTIIQKGAGQITFSASGTTINNRQSHDKTAGQHAVVGLVADVANNFYLTGDTTI